MPELFFSPRDEHSLRSQDELWLSSKIERLIEQIDFSIKLRQAMLDIGERQSACGNTATLEAAAPTQETAALRSCREMLGDTLSLLGGVAHRHRMTS